MLSRFWWARASSWRRALDDAARRLFGRCLKLRMVSAGGCYGCEADVNVLGHPEVHDGAAAVVPVDLCVPGCPRPTH